MRTPASGTNIQDFVKKCKRLLGEALRDWGMFSIIFLVGVSAFGLGRLSATEEVRPAVGIRAAPKLSEPEGMYPGGQYMASRTGTVYYFPWCGGAQKIAPENQVWFATAEAAEKAGYAPAKNCKGL